MNRHRTPAEMDETNMTVVVLIHERPERPRHTEVAVNSTIPVIYNRTKGIYNINI